MNPDRKRLSILLGVLTVVAILSFWPSSGGAPSTPRSAARESSSGRPAAARSPGYTVDNVPTPAVSGPGEERPYRVVRNVFAFATPTPVPTPTPLPPTPTPLPRPCEPGFIGPCPTPPPPTATPIVPPSIPYRVMGLFGPQDHLIVALEDSGRLINAREGDVLDGRFIVRKINNESVDFAFVQLPPDITRRLPIKR